MHNNRYSELSHEKFYVSKSFDDIAETSDATQGIENLQNGDTFSCLSVKENGGSPGLIAKHLYIIPSTSNSSTSSPLIVGSGYDLSLIHI